jgi:hypothetical protein
MRIQATQSDLKVVHEENDTLRKAQHALELKLPLFARQGKNTVPPPTGDVTLCFTDVEVRVQCPLNRAESVAKGSTVQWEWDADSMVSLGPFVLPLVVDSQKKMSRRWRFASTTT